MARKHFPQAVPPPYADAGEYTRTEPPFDSRPFQGDLLGSYGDGGFAGNRESNPGGTPEPWRIDPWGLRSADEGPFTGSRGATPDYRGRGPKGWRRTDESIRERVCDVLEASPDIDAREIEVEVHEGQVTLSGHVQNRPCKRKAEDAIAHLPGVVDVHNRLAVDASLFEEVREHFRP